MAGEEPLLELKGLRTWFYTDEGIAKAVDGVDYVILPGETLGVVGESGCGKSVTALSIMRLIPQPPGKIVDGQILLRGVDLTQLPENEMRKIRGNEIGMIFQEPMTSLNPVFTVGDQIAEAVLLHQDVDKAGARQRAIEMLAKVKIPSPEERVDEYWSNRTMRSMTLRATSTGFRSSRSISPRSPTVAPTLRRAWFASATAIGASCARSATCYATNSSSCSAAASMPSRSPPTRRMTGSRRFPKYRSITNRRERARGVR